MTANFSSIGKAKVTVEESTHPKDWIVWNGKYPDRKCISSVHCDSMLLLQHLLNIARQKAASLIHGEKVKVNWAVRDQPAFELQESDMLSIRGSGRFKVIAIEGRTRKDKIQAHRWKVRMTYQIIVAKN